MRDLETAYFHLDLDRQLPSNPDLIDGILKELKGDVRSIPLVADEFSMRLADSSLLAGIKETNRNNDGLVVEAVGRALHEYDRDVWEVLETITSPQTGLKGRKSTIFTFFEGRDDNQGKHYGGVLHLQQYLKDLQSHSNRKNSAFAVWDVHSRETLDYLRQANGRWSLNKPEVVSLTAMPLFADKLREDGLLNEKEMIVAAPDFGSFTKALQMSRFLDKPLIFIDKYRPEPNHLVIRGIYMINGDGKIKKLENSYLKGKKVIFFDDMLDTGGTAVDLSTEIKKEGAEEIVFCATHGVFSDRPEDKIKGEKTNMSLVDALNINIIDYFYVSDSLPQYKKIMQDPYLNDPDKVRFISLAKPIASLIRIAADKASEKDFDLVRRCLYNPGPDKDIITQYFERGNILPVYEDYDPHDAIVRSKFPWSGVVFSRTKNKVASIN